jgi:hypothetical protein
LPTDAKGVVNMAGRRKKGDDGTLEVSASRKI